MTQVLSKLASITESRAKLGISRIAVASSVVAVAYWSFLMLRPCTKDKKGLKSKEESILFLDQKAKKKGGKKKINYRETFRSLKIIIRFITSYKEVLLACGVSVGLIFRTLLDLWNIQVSTQVESAIIAADGAKLKSTLASFALAMPTLALVNNMIKFFSDKLRLQLRYRLSRALYEKYMEGLTYYQLSQNPDYQNVDQLIVADVDKFCLSMVEVYNNISKPILDIVLLVHRMTTGHTGFQTPAIMISWLAIVGAILMKARQPLSTYIVRETQAEGQLRFIHSRLIQNSEEVAFYRGQIKERNTLIDALDKMKDIIDDSILFKLKLGFLDNIVGRYSSTIVGYLALARPFFSETNELATRDDRLSQYYVSGRMMMKLAESITRVILAGADVTKLAAYTQRVDSLIKSMDQLKSGTIKSRRNIPSGSFQSSNGSKVVVEICPANDPVIDFENVTLSTPNGDILVKNLTFTIKSKQSVIVAGPNGSGKSSLFRVLGGLWEVESGRMVKPNSDQLFYICQKPYMTLGTFRDQIIFPDVKSKVPDAQLVEVLQIVELKYLLDREYKLDSLNDWQDVLSGGEKQRMALARLIYHKPQFAILDECTSAVALDVEQKIYKYLSEDLNCTLLSVTHRVKQLAKFHHLILEFDGNGSFEFRRLVAPFEV